MTRPAIHRPARAGETALGIPGTLGGPAGTSGTRPFLQMPSCGRPRFVRDAPAAVSPTDDRAGQARAVFSPRYVSSQRRQKAKQPALTFNPPCPSALKHKKLTRLDQTRCDQLLAGKLPNATPK
eukprot:gene8861-biopygen22667